MQGFEIIYTTYKLLETLEGNTLIKFNVTQDNILPRKTPY